MSCRSLTPGYELKSTHATDLARMLDTLLNSWPALAALLQPAIASSATSNLNQIVHCQYAVLYHARAQFNGQALSYQNLASALRPLGLHAAVEKRATWLVIVSTWFYAMPWHEDPKVGELLPAASCPECRRKY